MIRQLLLACMLAGSAKAATIVSLTPTVMKVTVGVSYCYAYFHYPNYKWDFEMACFSPGGETQYIQVNVPGITSDNTVRLPTGFVTWQLKAAAGGYEYQITGQDDMDVLPALVTGTL